MKKKQLGQTTVEYIFLLALVVLITLSLFKKLNEYLVENPDSFLNRYLDQFKANLSSEGGGSERYRWYKLIK